MIFRNKEKSKVRLRENGLTIFCRKLMLFQCEGKGIVGFLCILIRTDGITIVLIHIVANQCNFLYDAEVACFDGVTAIGVSIHIVEDGGNPLWLLCIIGGEKLTADSF